MDLPFRFMLKSTQISLKYLWCYIVRSTTSCLKEANSLQIKITKLLQISPTVITLVKMMKPLILLRILLAQAMHLDQNLKSLDFLGNLVEGFQAKHGKEKKSSRSHKNRSKNFFFDN